MYIPNFTPSSQSCIIPTFEETRARCSTSGFFFRSKNVGTQLNGFVIVCETTNGHIFNLLLKDGNNNVVENYTVTQNQTEDPQQQNPSIAALRALVNQSSLLEMPERGFDVQDIGEDPNNLSAFSGTFINGSGGPIDGSSIDSIRTGPTETLFCIRSTEEEHGNSVTSPQQVRTWNGTQWVVRL